MRGIQFRGKCVHDGKWVFGYLIGDDVIVGNIVEFNDEYFTTSFWWKVRPETIGQYADVPNRDDIKFYEGDIIRVPDYNPDYHVQQIVFKDGGFCGYNDKKHCKWTYLDVIVRANQTVKVIGNVHDNPELLEGNGIVPNAQRLRQSIS